MSIPCVVIITNPSIPCGGFPLNTLSPIPQRTKLGCRGGWNHRRADLRGLVLYRSGGHRGRQMERALQEVTPLKFRDGRAEALRVRVDEYLKTVPLSHVRFQVTSSVTVVLLISPWARYAL